ncbi:outer membrane autotransporter protein [Mycoplana sp. BE70]|uniref:autotransporter outer membrane beta-barrel domain-containing protein n=1 Tax=Mycoplana sp. BE70 TaxID=2817775 RepID=UPI0028625B77|nr:autotransporter domain-containing protein [Mycoplana sp. BE70]MDR6759246.1 outer membrane autotransporter protein [Mycoplana sp. BE70]
MVFTSPTTSSIVLNRKGRLLCATALMSVLLPLAVANAQEANYRYTDSGSYTDDIVINTRVNMSSSAGTIATYAGNLNFAAANAFLDLGQGAPNYGTIIFNPASITGIQTSPGSYSGILRIWNGRVQFGEVSAARDYFMRDGTSVSVLGEGILDLAGVDLNLKSIGIHGNTARVQNDATGTMATFSVVTGLSQGGLRDGAGTLRLRKTGSGSLLLGGVSDYSGGTEIAYGTVELNTATGIGSGTIEFNSSGTAAAELRFGADGLRLTNDVLISGTAGAMLTVNTGHSVDLGGAIAGSGPFIKYGNGTLALTGRNSFTGDTDVQYGTLVLDSGDAIADTNLVRISHNGTLRLAQSETINRLEGTAGSVVLDEGTILSVGAFNGNSRVASMISGAGGLRKQGSGTLELLANNSYVGETVVEGGRVLAGRDRAFGLGGQVTFRRASEDRSTLQLSNSVTIAQNMLLDDSFNLDNNDFSTLSGIIAGHNHLIHKVGQGTVSLTGESLDAPGAVVRAGGLSFDGRYSGNVEAAFGGTVTGSGRIEGDVVIADGGRLYGQFDRTLTMGSLTLGENSDIHILVDAPGTSAFFEVEGDLVLDGRLTIDDGVGVNFGQGIYRLFNYGGTLTNNGLDVVGVPDDSRYDIGDIEIQTAIDKQVNILVGGDPGPGPDPRPDMQFWDGANTTADGSIAGGNGVWRNGSTNWTTANGEANHDWGSRFAIFQGGPGTITVRGADGAVSVTGMQFAVDGYHIEGDAITLAAAETVIRVGDGSQAGANYVATIASKLRGDGALIKDDLGTLVLTGNSSYRGDTIVRAGTLVGDTRSIRNNIGNNGHVVFNQDGDAVFAGSIYGRGAMEKSGLGTLTLAGRNDLDWTISQGGLASRTDLFGGDVSIAANSFMRFQHDESGTYRGTISGEGEFQVAVGNGNLLRLTGDSSAFGGGTSVTSGGLMVDGRLGGDINMDDGTVLAGVGTMSGSVNINTGATIAPGNSIGTLTIAGNIHFREGSAYEVEVNREGQSDLVDVSGSAYLDGGAVRVIAGTGNYTSATRYTILTADGGVNGTYTDGVASNLAFLDPSLSYDDNNVYLTMTRNSVAFDNVGVTRNQVATGGGVESLGEGNAVYDAVLNLSAEQARYAFDQLSGELHASAKTALIEDSRFVRNAVNDRLRAAYDGVGASGAAITYENGVPQPVAANTDRFALWSQGFGSWGHTNGDGNAAPLNRKTGGFFLGADAPVFDTWRFGAAAGYSHTSFDAKDRHSSGSSDSYHLGLYSGTAWGDLAFRTGAAYTWHDISTSRNVAFPGFTDSLKGDYNAGTAQVFGELAYGFSMGAARFEPFANLAYVNLHTDSFREAGGAAALTSASANTDTTFTTLGLRASTSFDLSGASVTARGTLGWRHAFDDVMPTSTMRFAGADNTFAIAGVPVARDAAVVEAGFDLALTANTALGVTYGGQFGSEAIDQSFKANFNAKF